MAETWRVHHARGELSDDWIHRMLAHKFKSPLSGIYSLQRLAWNKSNSLKNKLSQSHVRNIMFTAQEITEPINNILDYAAGDTINIGTSSERYHKIINLLDYLLPCLPVIEEIETLNETQKRICKTADNNGEIIVYTANKTFSQDFESANYRFREDVFTFLTNIQTILNKNNLVHSPKIIEEIKTKADYVENSIEPLFWNILDHAFNPENDINNRDDEYSKTFSIQGIREENTNIEGQYRVSIADNGFGIKPEILPHIFERGFTTKEDNGLHGFGLYGVKEYVEKNGGRISAQSELGEGTTFTFTIPYETIDDQLMQE